MFTACVAVRTLFPVCLLLVWLYALYFQCVYCWEGARRSQKEAGEGARGTQEAPRRLLGGSPEAIQGRQAYYYYYYYYYYYFY